MIFSKHYKSPLKYKHKNTVPTNKHNNDHLKLKVFNCNKILYEILKLPTTKNLSTGEKHQLYMIYYTITLHVNFKFSYDITQNVPSLFILAQLVVNILQVHIFIV